MSPKLYDMWDELKIWLEKFDSEELIGVDKIEAKMEELEYEYE
jgi:hypothetical protein